MDVRPFKEVKVRFSHNDLSQVFKDAYVDMTYSKRMIKIVNHDNVIYYFPLVSVLYIHCTPHSNNQVED